MSIKVRLRTDTKEPGLQVTIMARPPGSLKAKRYRYTAPRSITSKSGAVRWGESVRREIEAGNPPQSKASIATTVTEETEAIAPKPASMTLRAAVEVYLTDAAGRGNVATTLKTKMSRFRNILGLIGDTPLATVGEAEASKMRGALRLRGMCASTLNAHVRLLQSVINRCHLLGYRSAPAARLEVVRERRIRVPKAYDAGTFELLVQVATNIDHLHLGLLLVCGEAGLRCGEVCGLEVRDYDARALTLRVERSVSGIGQGELVPPKNGESRDLILTERTALAVAALCQNRDIGAPMFEVRGQRMSKQDVRTMLERCQRLAGIPAKGVHVLRHSAASAALAGGADVVAVQKLLGHTALKTTVDAYLHDTGGALQRAVVALTSARGNVIAGVTDLTRVPKSSRKARGGSEKSK